MNKATLRPVTIRQFGKTMKGYFHRFVYEMANYHSETKVLVELEDGKLRYFDPYFVQFTDRKHNSVHTEKQKEELNPSDD